jgi:ribosomal protein S18 acetylase RimI-like enzyme
MSLHWIREPAARWDSNKLRLVGEAETGIFDVRYRALNAGDLVPGDWFRVEDDGKVVGYGWLDVVWGDAEILLATDPTSRRKGIGTFILDQLEAEARARSLHYLYNVIRPTHPRGRDVAAFLEKRGFRSAEDGRLIRQVPKKPA